MNGQAWVVRNKEQAEFLCQFIMDNCNRGLVYEIVEPTRSSRQNRGIHAYCGQLAREMADAGIDMRKALKPEITIEPTKELVKTTMWHPIQQAMFGTKSTSKLKTSEVDQVYRVLDRHTSERWNISVRFGR